MVFFSRNGWLKRGHRLPTRGNDSNRQKEFIGALNQFGIDSGAIKKKSKLSKVTGATAGIKCEVEFDTQSENLADLGLVQLIKNLSKKHKTLLLLDEIQALALSQKNDDFLTNLRTALDTNKDRVKVIFTGSSREKLQQMFSSAQAPFFHFGQNLNFPLLEMPFIKHLCHAFKRATQRQINDQHLWDVFLSLGQSPQLARSLIERMALHPNLDLDSAKNEMLADLYDDRNYISTWQATSALGRSLLTMISCGEEGFYSRSTLDALALRLGMDSIKTSSVQGALRSLRSSGLIFKSSVHGKYIIEDPLFCEWVKNKQPNT